MNALKSMFAILKVRSCRRGFLKLDDRKVYIDRRIFYLEFKLVREFNSPQHPGRGVVRESFFGELVQILKRQGDIDSHES